MHRDHRIVFEARKLYKDQAERNEIDFHEYSITFHFLEMNMMVTAVSDEEF